MGSPPAIYVVDNSFNSMYRSLDFLRVSFPGLRVCSGEGELFEAFGIAHPDVLLLNLDLRPTDAIHLTSEVRKLPWAARCRIVIYSDKQDDFVQELALNAGADGFINFHHKPAVLKLFIENLLRRGRCDTARLRRPLEIDAEAHLAYVNGKPVDLPRKEFRLLALLVSGAGRFFSKREIALQVWNSEAVSSSRTIDVHIYNIRRLFGHRVIQSQKGKGYRINRRLL